MKVIQSSSIGRLHELAVQHVLYHSRNVLTEDKETTIESEPLTLVCRTPFDPYRISQYSSIKESMMREYAKNLIYGYVDSVFEYDYHTRLYDYKDNLNQIEYIVDKLKQAPTSRRAQAITWQPVDDMNGTDVPCLQYVQFHIVDGKLDMTVVFRSNDMLLAAGANMYALTELQKNIADELGLPVGTYTHIALIPHIYFQRDWDELKRFTGT